MNDHAILDELRLRRPTLLAELVRLVEYESPSNEKEALRALGEHLVTRFSELGGEVQRLDDNGEAFHVQARFSGPEERRPALLLGHFDTVWPLGTLENMPVREAEGRLFGPGVYDMKASLLMIATVVEVMGRLKIDLPRPLLVLLNSDEETGSPSSRQFIEELARQSEYVLVLEPPLPDGGLKTARKGVGRFTIEVEGKAAHAGVAPEQGCSAIVELAHQVLRVNELNDSRSGTTVSVGLIRGGTAVNVVPAHASAEVDVRATSLAAAATVEAALRSLAALTPGTRVTVRGGFVRPPMERTPAIAALFVQAREIAARLGLELSEGSTGGGSDGNFTAALGVPTLDGLGVQGGGAHAENEHIVIDSLAERAALLAALLLHL
jgi:glutamate carboxypeptidase